MAIDPDKFRKCRLAKNLTQPALAKLAGLKHYRDISRIEQGVNTNPRIGLVQKCAKAMGVPIEKLLR